LPGEKISEGHLHPVTQVLRELEDMFVSMGFKVLEGPELESDYYCFEALNIPKWHPSRDAQDTFYIDPKGLKVRGERDGQPDLVMRTQTSPVQIRAMQKYGAPLRCVVPGRVFRAEATDAVHEHTFYQLEGLMVGENISVANLIAVLKEIYSGIFKQEVKLRVRPGYFPFVEPGLEIDVGCTICGGKGCPSCKMGGWLEMAGAGLVHPKVLEAGGVDPKKYSGFAFGMGIERLLIMRHGINDIRLFESGDLRFLEQF
jgi:phenylalanyl-tRNA synthetase alpha chain